MKECVKKGVDVNLQLEYGYGDTALISASTRGHLEVVKYLVAKGADIEETDQQGFSALWYASNEGYTEIVEYLKRYSVTSLCAQSASTPVSLYRQSGCYRITY